MIAQAVADLRRDLGIPVDPLRRGPTPLNRFFEELGQPRIAHHALPDLTRGAVAEHLLSQGIPAEDLGDPAERLAGFLFFAGKSAWAYVSADEKNPLPRRRFTAAHELGHAVLHRDRMGCFRADVQILEGSDETTEEIEREANQFAAELLMPADLLQARAEELKREFGCCPRSVLEYRLAAELLVSQQAMHYRLKSLGVGDA